MATGLSNDYLEMVNIHATCRIGVLSTEAHHGAERILKNRINARITRQLKDLNTRVDNLEHAYEKMQSTLDELNACLFGLREMDGDDANGPFLEMVVFTTLTCRDIVSSLELILDMHGKELEIKRNILNDYKNISSEQRKGGPEEQSQEYWMLHITAWALDVEISKEFVNNAMKQIARDASLPY